jgi:outer membrane protein OmpU
MLSYKGQFQDLGLKASYRFADRDVDANDEFSDNGKDGYSLSAIYAIGDSGVKLGAGYADQDQSNEYMLSASYRISDFYFAGVFTDGEKQTTGVIKNDSVDYTGYEFAAAYTLDKTAFTLTYNNAETDGETSADNVAIDATYYFKPNFRTYISYNFNLISENDTIGTTNLASNGKATSAQAEDEIALGLRYDF